TDVTAPSARSSGSIDVVIFPASTNIRVPHRKVSVRNGSPEWRVGAQGRLKTNVFIVLNPFFESGASRLTLGRTRDRGHRPSMRLALHVLVFAAFLAEGCSGGVGAPTSVSSDSSLSILPATATTSRGGEVDFHASIAGDRSVEAAGFNWSVEEPNGGVVDTSGRYAAPQASR